MQYTSVELTLCVNSPFSELILDAALATPAASNPKFIPNNAATSCNSTNAETAAVFVVYNDAFVVANRLETSLKL